MRHCLASKRMPVGSRFEIALLKRWDWLCCPRREAEEQRSQQNEDLARIGAAYRKKFKWDEGEPPMKWETASSLKLHKY